MTTPAAGGKHATKQTSAEFQAECAEFQRYKNELNSLPPSNSEANAKLHRQVLLRHTPTLGALFNSLGLDY